MASFNISNFKAQGLINGGARPTQFQVEIFPPFTSSIVPRMQFLCKAASIPAMQMDTIPIKYFGRSVKFSGDREFPDWTVTVYNDDDYAARVMLEKWNNQLNTLSSNRMDPAVYPTGYKGTAKVTQFNKIGDIVRVYEFRGLFPSNIDPINLDWDSVNQVEQFDVTFSYDEWVPDQAVQTSEDDYSPLLPDDGLES